MCPWSFFGIFCAEAHPPSAEIADFRLSIWDVLRKRLSVLDWDEAAGTDSGQRQQFLRQPGSREMQKL